MSKNIRNRLNVKKTSLVAAALQDHLIKKLDLDLNTLQNGRENFKPKSQFQNKYKNIESKILKTIEQSSNSTKSDQPRKELIINCVDEEPSLAEKLGIVKAPYDILDEKEWTEVKENSRKREDFKQPCVICREDLGPKPQVLLSCSHTFHFNCLKAFEKYSGKKSCPMCRKSRYQMRIVYDASDFHRNLMASRIQAAWKGYVARKWYNEYRRYNPPKDKILRKKYFEDKLIKVNQKFVDKCDLNADQLLNDISANIQHSRMLSQQLDTRLNRINEEEWLQIEAQALSREVNDCCICMVELATPQTQRGECLRRPIALLSCSHVFHDVCLTTFEQLQFKMPECPVCRSAYQKKVLC